MTTSLEATAEIMSELAASWGVALSSQEAKKAAAAAIRAYLEAEKLIVLDTPIIPEVTPEYFDPFRIVAFIDDQLNQLKDTVSND